MGLEIIFILIGIGIVLLLAEVLVLPGVNIAGVLGFLLIVTAIYFAFRSHGMVMGFTSLAVSVAGSLLSLVMAMRSKTWERLSLKTNIESQVTDPELTSIKLGSEGISITPLNPIGKVKIEHQVYDARIEDGYLEKDQRVIVKAMGAYEIIVKPLN